MGAGGEGGAGDSRFVVEVRLVREDKQRELRAIIVVSPVGCDGVVVYWLSALVAGERSVFGPIKQRCYCACVARLDSVLGLTPTPLREPLP